ncbi:MAG: CAP domain-containing protein, partial [Anaerolineae bacterium]|nr:CAP domain-containing protein [Anaerolineae bacterium]
MRHNHRAAFWAALYASGALVLTTQGTPIYAHEKELLGLPVILEHQLVAPEPFLLQPSFSGCTVQVFLPVNPDFEQQVVELVNDHRHSVNRPPLKRVTLLDEAARYHARDMREDDYFSHDTRDRVNGVPEFVCSWHTRIGSHYPGWSSIGENIAAGHSSPHSVMNAWLSSTYHRNNIESTNFREIGVGFD